MKITDLISSKTIDINASALSKEDILKQAVALIAKSGNITDVEEYQKGVFAREEESTTGIGEGIAIPHCKSDVVKAPALAAMVIKDGVDFNSLDGEKVNLLFLIAAPNTKDNVHLEVLSRLSTMLLDDDFKAKLIAAKTKKEFLAVIDAAEVDKKEAEAKEKEEDAKVGTFDLLGVTGCPNGIAHTYMAEDNLKAAAKELGYTMKVETQGSAGVGNPLTDDDIANAKAIVIAADINVDTERFNGKRVLKATVAQGISQPKELINKALNAEIQNPDKEAVKSGNNDAKESVVHQIYKHLMSGVSHMLPFVIGGGILIALAFLIDTLAGNAATAGSAFGTVNPVANWFKTVGGWGMNLMLPILAGFIAYSIAGRPGLAVGMLGGYIATQSTFSISYSITGEDLGSSGFLGAIAAGFAAGYIIKGLAYAFKWMPKSAEGLKPMLVYPVLGFLCIGVSMYLLNTPFAYINMGVSNGLSWLGEHQLTLLLGVLLAGMMAVDMGGPINKAAYVFGTAMLAEASKTGVTLEYQQYCWQMMAAVMIGGMVPPLGIALSANLFPQKYTKQERKDAMVNYVMGLSFITEGAIPYAAKDPIRVIPACVAGSAVAGFLSTLFGCSLLAPHGGLFVVPTIQYGLGNLAWLWFIVSLIAGTFVTALLLGLLKKDEPNAELGNWKGIRLHK